MLVYYNIHYICLCSTCADVHSFLIDSHPYLAGLFGWVVLHADFKSLFSLSHWLLESSLLTCGEEAAPSQDLVDPFTTAQPKVDHLPFQILRLLLNLIKSQSGVTGVGPHAIVSHAGSWNLLWKCSDSFR